MLPPTEIHEMSGMHETSDELNALFRRRSSFIHKRAAKQIVSRSKRSIDDLQERKEEQKLDLEDVRDYWAFALR
jgi:hypothetical protein